LVQDSIEKIVPAQIKVTSQAKIVANSLQDYLARHAEIEAKCSKNKQVQFFTTDSTQDFDNHAVEFFGQAVKSNHLDLNHSKS
jgi:glutamate racemase